MITRRLLSILWLCCALAAGLVVPGRQAHAASCAAATGQGTAPNDYKNYCWLDFSGYNDTAARSAGGQAFVFSLPDGSTLSMTVKTAIQNGTGTPALAPVAVPSWSGAAFGNSAFFGIPGQPILYTVQNASTIQVSLSGIAITPPAGSGGVATYAIIAADGESTNSSESLSFTTNGAAWVQLAQIANGTAYPTVSGVGTNTVSLTGVAGTVGSYVFGSSGNPTSVSSALTAGGLQGIALGVRYASISLTANLSNARVDITDQFTYAIKTTGGTTINSASTTGTALSGFALAGFPTLAASYPIVLNQVMAAGSASSLGNYLETLTCTNASSGSSTVLPTNVVTNNYTTPSLRYGDAIACVFTDTPYPRISGTLYNDANHNFSLDGAETGTGLTGLYVKLSAYSGSCAASATQAAAVDPTSGTYTFPGVPYGSYCLTLTNNATLSNTTAYQPPGWIRTEASGGIRQVVLVSGAQPPRQNFGIYNGTQVSATVFADTGVTAGAANDGAKNAAESGIANVTVTASVSGSLVGSGITDASGLALVWLPAGTSGTVVVTPTAPSGYVPTGGAPGTSLGTYTRPSVTFTYVVGQSYTGLVFGLVPPNNFSTDGGKTVPAGTTLYYPHTYIAGSAGSLTLSTSAVATPALVGWSEVLYLDASCSGQVVSGAPLINAPIAVTSGQQVCFLVKEFVPTNAALNAENKVTVSALLTYSGSAAPASNTLLHTDTTTVAIAGAMQLSKQVKNVTTGGASGTSSNAAPGNTLQYQLTLNNAGTGALANVVVADSTPAYTLFVSAACPGTLPSGLTACAVSAQPAVGGQGALQWTFSGTLAPGASAVVSYTVTVAN